MPTLRLMRQVLFMVGVASGVRYNVVTELASVCLETENGAGSWGERYILCSWDSKWVKMDKNHLVNQLYRQLQAYQTKSELASRIGESIIYFQNIEFLAKTLIYLKKKSTISLKNFHKEYYSRTIKFITDELVSLYEDDAIIIDIKDELILIIDKRNHIVHGMPMLENIIGDNLQSRIVIGRGAKCKPLEDWSHVYGTDEIKTLIGDMKKINDILKERIQFYTSC